MMHIKRSCVKTAQQVKTKNFQEKSSVLIHICPSEQLQVQEGCKEHIIPTYIYEITEKTP
jgi:hypothetical protein